MATQSQEEKEVDADMIEPRDAIPAVAWLDMMYEESGLTEEKANKAASIIQVNKIIKMILYCILYKIISRISYFMLNLYKIK